MLASFRSPLFQWVGWQVDPLKKSLIIVTPVHLRAPTKHGGGRGRKKFGFVLIT